MSDADDFFGLGDPAKMPDVMIDVETMGTRPNAPLLSLGAVAFNRRTLELGERFYVNIDLTSAVESGAVIDPGTVMWWLEQSDDARKALLRDRVHINVALQRFAEWLEQCSVEQKARKIWACGTDFDCVIVSEHYYRASRPVPWEFYNFRDYRTIREEVGVNIEQDARVGKHNALDDALHQVNHLFKIRKAQRGN